MLKKLLLLASALGSVAAIAQSNYQSASNKYYWKNRKPHAAYWQQDVEYRIKANLNDSADVVNAREELTYYNNSPDELSFVYFHLYNNAQLPGSYLDDLYHHNNIPTKYGKDRSKGLGTTVSNLSVNGVTLKTELDNTVLKVFLAQPLKPGQSITFTMSFSTYFDKSSIRNRMKLYKSFGYKHFDGVHWYPRIAVYDHKFGWETYQHMDHEFYGDYGTYDVELNMPEYYVTEATGVLQNESEVLPDTLRKKLDIKNFANKRWNEKPSEPITVKGNNNRKTWRYHAENVHDFAFTADPTYRIGGTTWNGIKCIAVAQEQHASRWQNAAEYTAKIIKYYSEFIGMYAYPKMVVADAEDGMEYPMLTLDGGKDPDYRGLFAHEVGHNWFFGMVGNNETYRAAMDEGFTQFLTTAFMEKHEGKYDTLPIYEKSKYIRKYYKPSTTKYRTSLGGYITDAIRDNDATLNTHSDDYGGAIRHDGGYKHVYYKSATMLYNLQYVLGDSVFKGAMQHYFSKWMIAHPYFEDFRDAITEYTHTDLNWFFDQWIETTKHIDYAVKCVKPGEKADEFVITFERKGEMEMPLDFTVTSKDDKQYNFIIPNGWYVKPTTASVLPRWIGWNRNVRPTYEAKVTIPGGIHDIEIDTTHRLADVNMLNNKLNMPYDVRLDSKVASPADWTKYEVKVAPDAWYNNYDGIKAGVHLSSGYLNYKHLIDASVWVNTGVGQGKIPYGININGNDAMSFRVNYRTGVEKFSKNAFVTASAKSLDGLYAGTLGYEQSDKSLKNTFYVRAKSMYRRNINALTYLLYPNLWNPKQFNNSTTFGFIHRYNHHTGGGNIETGLQTSTLGSNYQYSYLFLNAINNTAMGKLMLKTRVYGQYGRATNAAPESELYLAGANPEALMENKFTRSRGLVPIDWLGYGANTNHFHMGGGLNLRGYAGYLVAEADKNGNVRTVYHSQTGAALNAELEFDRLIKLQPKLFKSWLKINTYLFTDIGTIAISTGTEKLLISEPRMDAGVGTAVTIKRWWNFQTVNPLTIRFDMPFFLNRPPAVDPDYINFNRWVVGISRAF